MKNNKFFALLIASGLVIAMSATTFAGSMPADMPAAEENADSQGAEGGESAGEAQDGESAGGESAGGATSGTPDTSMGGSATSRPPDNSTKAIDILGTRAAVYIEYGEDGYTVTNNASDSYKVELGEMDAPVIGSANAIKDLYIECSAIDWDAENEVGNSGLVINSLTDEETTFILGGEEDVYDAPNGEKYNSVVIMNMVDDEEYDEDATETAAGCGIAYNGKSLLINNAYVESNGTGRPSIHIPSSTRDSNVTQYSDLIVEDSYVINHSTRALLLMGGDVWFLNSTAITDSWGALSYDNTSTTMYVVNSISEQTGTGYSIYDAAGCTTYVYGSSIMSGGTGITVCRDATLTVANLSEADEAATAPYTGTADLLSPAVTADGKTIIAAYAYPIKIHADMSGADSVAAAYINDAYLSSCAEDIALTSKEFVAASANTASSGSDAMNALVSDYEEGEIVEIACHNGQVTFDNCELNSRKGVLVQSFFAYDSMASGIYPVDGAEYAGDAVTFKNMSATGDILHEDYMRKMDVTLENAELTGKVMGTTLTGWNNYWKEQIESINGDENDALLVIHDEVYETLWGVRMSVDADSTWNVAEGTSQLYSFTMEDGATVQPVDGKSMTIYVDCTMDNSLESYDTAAGTQIDAFEPGVEYSGVVIVVE
jgi:hypothetical protein